MLVSSDLLSAKTTPRTARKEAVGSVEKAVRWAVNAPNHSFTNLLFLSDVWP